MRNDFRRFYAFEAEGVSDEVKTELKKVEDNADELCDTAAKCDTVLDKIEEQKEKFNDALSSMADSAKKAKDGEIDKSEMASEITPKMAEIKEIAENAGVATEGDTVTKEELEDAKAFLEGAEEIVEAKKAELGDDDVDDEEEATESFGSWSNSRANRSARRRRSNDVPMDAFIAACESFTIGGTSSRSSHRSFMSMMEDRFGG